LLSADEVIKCVGQPQAAAIQPDEGQADRSPFL
jgi:hypothetical protein